MKDLKRKARSSLESLLTRIPAVVIDAVQDEYPASDWCPDFVVRLQVSGLPYMLIVDIRRNGQPRIVRMAALQLRTYLTHFEIEAVPVLIAPYLSEASRKICEEFGIGFMDLVGNARLQFGSVYIDRTVAEKPKSEQRLLKSIFASKAARILRVMLRDPQRPWRLTELAQAARVSLGHSSNVRKALIDREWAEVSSGGVALTDPNALLDA